jgi:hypothetical protein
MTAAAAAAEIDVFSALANPVRREILARLHRKHAPRVSSRAASTSAGPPCRSICITQYWKQRMAALEDLLDEETKKR